MRLGAYASTTADRNNKIDSMPERQYDISRYSINYFATLPYDIPYKLNAESYVFFNYPDNFPFQSYRVLVESMSNASPYQKDRFRDIGPLQRKVELPDVHFSKGFGSAASLLVVPSISGLPSFLANLYRGNTYTIDPQNMRVLTKQGHLSMNRTGVI